MEKETKEDLQLEDQMLEPATVQVVDHLLIRDKETGEELVNKRG